MGGVGIWWWWVERDGGLGSKKRKGRVDGWGGGLEVVVGDVEESEMRE